MGNKLFYRIRLPALLLVLAGTYSGLTTTHAQTIRPGTQKELKIFDPTSNASGNIGLRAAAGTSSYTLTLPSSVPSASQVLGVSGISGDVATLTWTTVSVSAVSTFSGGTTGLTPAPATSGAVTLAGTLGVANGGTGRSSQTANMPIVGGTTITGPQQSVAAGTTTGQPLLFQGSSSLPTFSALNLAGGTNIITGTLPVSNGGTGVATISGILNGNGTSAVTGITSSSGLASVITDETGSGALVFGTAPTINSLTVATGGATITAGGLTVTAGGGNITGNILLNNTGTASELRFREPSGSGSEYTSFRAQAQSGNVTYLLPTSDGSNGQVLSTNGGGTLSWITTTSVPISSLIAATGINTINNTSFGQTWQWNTLAGSSALLLSTNSTAAAGNAQTLLSLSMSGANTTSSQTTYGGQISNTHTGISSTNVGLQINTSGGTNNYGLLVASGEVGIGITTPANALHIDRGTATPSYLQFTAATTTGQTSADGFDVGIDATGAAILNQQENLALSIATNNTTRLTIAATGESTFTGNVTAPAFFETSDMRLKNIIKRDKDLVYFKWNDNRDSLLHIGYVAQEVQRKMPNQVGSDQKGFLSVNYIEVLVFKIRELEKKIEILEKTKKDEK